MNSDNDDWVDRAFIASVVIYVAGFIGTYGHAFNTIDSKYPEQRAVGAFVCAVVWPLYVSTEAWK